MASIPMPRDWLNSQELPKKNTSNNYNFADSFYSNRSRVGMTGFFLDCFAGKQDDLDLESAPNQSNPQDESLASTLIASTRMLTSAVSSFTSGFTGLFSWKTSTPEIKVMETTTYAAGNQELFEVVVDGEKQISVIPTEKAKVIEATVIEMAKADKIEAPVAETVRAPSIKFAKPIPVIESNVVLNVTLSKPVTETVKASVPVVPVNQVKAPVIEASKMAETVLADKPAIHAPVIETKSTNPDLTPAQLPIKLQIINTNNTTANVIQSPKMSDISYKEITEDENLHQKQQSAELIQISSEIEEDYDYVDTSDYWYKGPTENNYEDDEDKDDVFEKLLSRSLYSMPSYIDFSQDSSIIVKRIPKCKDSRNLKVHFEPMVELMDHVVNNDKASIKKVLQEGKIRVNDCDKLGYTMLHYAASHNHTDLMKYLIEKEGADVNSIDSTYWSPLHLAAIADNLKACKVLLEHGANFEYPNSDENLPVDLTEDVKVKKLFADATKKKLSAKKVKALYDWKAESPEHLSVKRAEGLKVLERKQEFWLLQNAEKEVGLVPRIFVQ